MRCRAFFATFLAAASVAGHPLCWDDTPTDLDQVLKFCPKQQSGACCSDQDELELQTTFAEAGNIADATCEGYYKELICGQCHSYSGHLYARLLPALGLGDGLTMTKDFCKKLVTACTGKGNIVFPTYDDPDEGTLDYCERHTGTQSGDQYWSYPFIEDETFDPGLNEAFPGVNKPSKTLSVKQSPDGGMFWIMGQEGEIKSVNAGNPGTATQVLQMGPNNTATIDGNAQGYQGGGFFHVQTEEGCLDFAFDPNFGGSSSAFYLSYTVRYNDGKLPRNRLSKFKYTAGNAGGTRASEEILLTTTSKATGIHAAGWVDFPPQAFANPGSSNDIYWSSGDGGGQTDPLNVGQDASNMLGAIMRITVPSGSSGYSTPSGNIAGAICATGMRNPWRCGFDKGTQQPTLYCGDVGHTKVEEIDIIECGKNYGWSLFEGSRCQAGVPNKPQNFCPGLSSANARSAYTFPYFEYCHPDYQSQNDNTNTGNYDLCGERQITGHAVIGGYVYRGELFADLLDGAYVFADTVNKDIYYLKEEPDGTIGVGTIISDGSVEVIGFSQTNSGELLVIDRAYDIYNLPCGDLCDSTCLDMAEDLPTFEYEGCFKDVISNRALPIQAPKCPEGQLAMSAETCASYCATIPGMAYMGVQYGFQCFCGGSGSAFGKHGSANNCDYPCSSTPDETCGGLLAMEVFSLGAPATTTSTNPVVPNPSPVSPSPINPTGITLLGCFKDVETDRIMTSAGTDSPMGADVCAAKCAGSPYFATQFNNQCWCGTTDDYDKHGTSSKCNRPCTGNTGEICGGYYAASVYSNGGGGPAPSPVDPAPSPVVAPSPVNPTGITLLGCFKDVETDRTMTLGTNTSPMSPEICAEECSGSPYFGLQFNTQCWCGSTDDYDKHGTSSKCNRPCAGNTDQICGGYYAASVYSNGGGGPAPSPVAAPAPSPVAPVTPPSPVAPAGITSLGCFTDKQNDRIMTLETASTSMTTAACSAACSGSPYFATQFGKQCWCGSSNDYDKHGKSSKCTMSCAGDSGDTCGGYDAASVYSNGGGGPAPTPVAAPAPTPVAPAPTPVVAPSPVNPTGITLLGCFKDVETDRTMTLGANTSPMSPEICAGECSGSPYFGLQFNTQCWCGSNEEYDKHGTSSKCNRPCAGNTDQICGGYYAVSVYSNGGGGPAPSPVASAPTPVPPVAPAGITSLGCFTDKQDDRIMTLETASTSMTTAACSAACSGSPYFATQFGKQCWCGSSNDYDKHGKSSKCTMSCAGDSGDTCGGYDAASVYSN